jgi:hypothetical protein
VAPQRQRAAEAALFISGFALPRRVRRAGDASIMNLQRAPAAAMQISILSSACV